MKIKINNLTKKYEDKTVFENFSTEIEFDDILFITGESGLGKTTLIRMIAKLEKPDSGSIECDESKISYMFQEDRLIPFVSVLKNLTAVCSEEKAIKYLEKVGLSNEKNNSPLSLSGGMKRRISLIRALCFDSNLVILDEPFKGLDEKLKESIYELIIDESKSRKFIIVSHDKSDIDKLGGKIYNLTK